MRKVFLADLPRWETGTYKGSFDLIKCIGNKVKFVYDDIEGEVEIIAYNKTNRKFTIKYIDEELNIKADNFFRCKLGNLLNKKTKDFKIEINKIFKSDKRELTIIDRCYRDRINRCEKQKWYRYICNKCGNKDWIEESMLLKREGGCNACCNPPKKLVVNINSIFVKDKCSIDIGISEEDAKNNMPYSANNIKVTCPHCKEVRYKKCRDIYRNKSIGCTCGDSYSYPEKVLYSMLKQLGVEFQTQLTKSTLQWCGKYRYDFYIPDAKIILETHGIQHYKESNRGRSLKEEQENDRIKKEIALKNGIKHYVELDCRHSELEWVKDNLLNSKLNKLFDLKDIDWLKCEEFAIKSNLVKEVCDYWNNKEEWETTSHLKDIFKLSDTTIRKYLKQGSKLDWCIYDAKEESIKSNKKNILRIKKNSKKVNMFKDDKLLGTFDSVSTLEKQSEELLGIKLLRNGVVAVTTGIRKTYKGFTFKYI